MKLSFRIFLGLSLMSSLLFGKPSNSLSHYITVRVDLYANYVGHLNAGSFNSAIPMHFDNSLKQTELPVTFVPSKNEALKTSSGCNSGIKSRNNFAIKDLFGKTPKVKSKNAIMLLNPSQLYICKAPIIQKENEINPIRFDRNKPDKMWCIHSTANADEIKENTI